jgi:transcriptional regulator with XRE-family HTH domain
MEQPCTPIGALLRSWRGRRGFSQLALATEAEISQKHLSFIESGRASPSRDMVLLLAEQLDVPLRDRNTLLQAAGFAPVFRERPLDDPALAPARAAIETVLRAHEPNPALVVNRHWDLVSANAAVAPLLAGVDPELLKPPANVMRIGLHPRGLAPLIVNLPEWRAHLLERLRRQYRATLDPALDALLTELSAFDRGTGRAHPRDHRDDIVVPLKLRTQHGVLSFFGTVTVFGTPQEITLSEAVMECFYPADAATADTMRRLVPRRD